jgi:uncharacterized protein (TIGR00730 family)
MSTIKSICVYCASGPGNNPAFMDAARKFGRILAENGIRLVYGGGSVGLMGALAESVLDHGGAVTGVIPDFLVNREHMLVSVQERLITRDMHERKRLMFERADAFVALPGGVGTLEELVEQLTWAQLGRHKKPILALNVARFWDPLCTLLEQMEKLDFIRAHLPVMLLVAERVEDILPKLLAAARSVAWGARRKETSRQTGLARRAKDEGRAAERAPPKNHSCALRNVTASTRLPSGSQMKAA